LRANVAPSDVLADDRSVLGLGQPLSLEWRGRDLVCFTSRCCS
jgi:hypothetical protein